MKREDFTESLDDMLAEYDPIDFGMITSLDMNEESFLL